jgi:amidophosphoribosyltransferase
MGAGAPAARIDSGTPFVFSMDVKDRSESLRHHCGVVGISSNTEINVPEMLFYGLFSLQHRGQESAGIAYRRHGRTVPYKDVGMVANALSHYLNEDHPSRVGIGHVRYSTHGTNKLENAQPMVISCNKGDIALGLNGNISNSELLGGELIRNGSIFQSTTDAELLLHMIAHSKAPDFYSALTECLARIEGAYCFLMMHGDTMVAVRDTFGFRPLVMGEKDGAVIIASETCALSIFQAVNVREIPPGHMVRVEGGKARMEALPLASIRKAHCIFELIYFARPDSEVFGCSVHMVRKRMGEALARGDAADSDIVIPVPDSGNSAALGYAAASGIPFEQGLTRNHYMGRTFIQPTTGMREFGVRMKLHPVRQAIEGKRVTVIDDSVVRGTTSGQIIKLIKDAGAKEVHLRLSSPPLKYPCFFGIDIPTREELISNRMDADRIARHIGADSVRFLSMDSLLSCVADPDDFCTACFSGLYPCPVRDAPVSRKQF